MSLTPGSPTLQTSNIHFCVVTGKLEVLFPEKDVLIDDKFAGQPTKKLSTPGTIQFSRSVVSDCLWPHGLQHARLPCPSPTPQLAQTHVHQDGDAIQPSHPLSSPSPPAFSLAQHQGLFQWVSSSHQVAKVLEFQLQHQSFQWIFTCTPGTGGL